MPETARKSAATWLCRLRKCEGASGPRQDDVKNHPTEVSPVGLCAAYFFSVFKASNANSSWVMALVQASIASFLWPP
jgi:hypothetical protein